MTIQLLDPTRLDFKQIEAIIELQMQSHRDFADEPMRKDGFVTLLTPPSFFREEEVVCFIAHDKGQVCGYIIGVIGDATYGNRILNELNQQLNNLNKIGNLRAYQRMILAQVCVHLHHRKQGIAQKLYEAMVAHADKLPGMLALFTEIDIDNKSSKQLHEKVGFKGIHEYQSGNQTFSVMYKPVPR